MPLYQVCKVKCDFCGKDADVLIPMWQLDNTSFNLENDVLKMHGFIRNYKIINVEQSDRLRELGKSTEPPKYACADPACREKLEVWSRE